MYTLALTKYQQKGNDGFQCLKSEAVNLWYHEHDLHSLDIIVYNFFANTRRDLQRRVSNITESILEPRLKRFGSSRGVDEINWSPDGNFVVLRP